MGGHGGDAKTFGVWESEEVLGTWPAKFKKQLGTLLLTPFRLVHIVDGAAAASPKVVSISDVDKAEISVKPQPPLAKITLQGGSVLYFEFVCPERCWEHQAQLKGKLAAAKAADEEESRCQAVLTGPLGSRELREQYSYLVRQTKAMMPNEFLVANAHAIQSLAPQHPQPGGVDLTAMQVGASFSKGTGSVAGKEVTLAAGEEAAMFSDFPAVLALYKSVVPSLLTPGQFWKRFFKSRYYIEATGGEPPTTQRRDPLFDALELPPRRRPPLSGTVSVVEDVDSDLTCNMISENNEAATGVKALLSHVGGGASQRKSFAAERLVTQLNERSAGALAAALASVPIVASAGNQRTEFARLPQGMQPGLAGTDSASALTGITGVDQLREVVERRRARLRNSSGGLKEDLGDGSNLSEPSKPSKIPRLEFQAAEMESEQKSTPTSANVPTRAHAAPNPSQDKALNNAQVRFLQSWARGPQLIAEHPTAAVRAVLQKATEEIQLHENLVKRAAAQVSKLPEDVAEVAGQAQLLLKHFWTTRLSEVSLRRRLASQLEITERPLAKWEQASHTGDGALRLAAARSFLPTIRRALETRQRYEIVSKSASSG